MNTLTELYKKHAPALEGQLAACENAEKTAALIGEFWGALRDEYIAGEEDPELRQRANGLIAVCQTASGLIAGMTRADVSIRLPGKTANPRARRAAREVRRYAAPVLCAALAVYLLLRNEIPACVIALICAGICLFSPAVKAPPASLPEAVAVPRPDPRETLRRLERLTRDADSVLSVRACTETDAPALTAPMLESIQMLCEASLTKDAAYALKTAAPVVMALEGQGVALALFDPEHAGWFDLLPGEPAGKTIRPALVKDGHLLARGQAIAPMR